MDSFHSFSENLKASAALSILNKTFKNSKLEIYRYEVWKIIEHSDLFFEDLVSLARARVWVDQNEEFLVRHLCTILHYERHFYYQ